MKPIVFNFNDSLLNRKAEAISLKAGYLLSEEVYSAGNLSLELFVRENTSGCTLTQKMNLLEKYFQDDPEMLSTVLQMKTIKKASDKIKYKVPGHIAAQKKAEESFHVFWNAVMDLIESDMFDFGYQELHSLEEDIVKYYTINTAAPESTGSVNITASNLMQRLLPNLKEDEEPEIFVLSNECFDEVRSDFTLYTSGNKKALNTECTCLYKCLSLPDFTSLTTDELKRLRKRLQQSIALFQENMNEWIDMCYFGDEVTDRITFFSNHVLPAAAVLQQCIDGKESPAIFGKTEKDSKPVEVWMGEIPVHQLWSYYHNYEVLKEASWNKLMKLKDADAYENQRWPIMVLKVPDFMLTIDEESEDEMQTEEIKATKKYLLID